MKKLLIFSIAIVSLLVTAQTTNAHFLAIDKNIGAVLHVDPNDSPPAGEQASLFFDIKDKENKFSLKNCNCRVDIYEGEKIIYSDAVLKDNKNPNLNTASFFYAFPQVDAYEVRLIGTPVSSASFKPFILSWSLRIDQKGKAADANQSKSNFFTTGAIYSIIGALTIIIVILILKKKANKKYVKKDDRNTY